MVYHVLNWGVGRKTLFDKDQDFLAFERVVEETLRTCAMRICAFCTLSNHWHFVLWPESDGDLPAFMQQMTNMHVKHWQEYRREIGYGHLYQGHYKCFPVEIDFTWLPKPKEAKARIHVDADLGKPGLSSTSDRDSSAVKPVLCTIKWFPRAM